MSKGLEALEKIKNAPTIYVGCASNIYTRYSFECKEIEKELQALEIINKKQVNVRAFRKALLMKQNDDVKLKVYNSQNHKYEDDLNQEEFDLLKEVLL